MKTIKKLTSVMLVALMLCSVVSATGISASAASTVYLDASAVTEGVEDFYAWIWTDGSTGSWTELTQGSQYYEVSMESGDYIIFARVPTGETPDDTWSNVWNQTGNLTYDGTNNLCTLTWGSGDSMDATWSVYTASDSDSSQGEGSPGDGDSGSAPGGDGGSGPGGDGGSAPGGDGGSAPGGDSSNSSDVTYTSVVEYTSDTTTTDETYISTGTDENAVRVYNGASVLLNNPTISRISSDSTGGDNSSFYGIGAGLLTTDGTTYVNGGTITTNAAGGAGAFAYGSGIIYIANTSITTAKDTSGGIHVAGGGTLYAWDLDVTTSGESSAAIRSDRGGGTMVVNGGSYVSNGTGSPAIYCTADIAVNNATLTANNSEAICIEGLNTLNLFDCDLTSNMKDDSQNDCTWSVILYQSMSGDSEVGTSTLNMTGGSLVSNNGGIFYTTNTESNIYISDVDITASDDCEFFLMCTGNNNQRGWGTVGSNGADCNFTASNQIMNGDVVYDSVSNLDFYMTNGSVLTGKIYDDETNAGSGGNGTANVYIDSTSKWIVTGNSEIDSLSNAGTIVDVDGKVVSIVGTDGTVYVSGTSEYTVTVSSYSTTVDLSGALTGTSWSDYEVELPEQLSGSSSTTSTTSPTDSTGTTTGSAEATTESTEATTESAEATTESTEATTESAEATTESTEATTESAEATTESTDATTESTEATTEPTEATTEPTEATTQTQASSSDATLSVSKAKLKAGKTAKASVSGADDATVTYTSSNKKVAKINKTTGKITALKKGKTTIKATVTYSDGSKKILKTKIKVTSNPKLKYKKQKVKKITVKAGNTKTVKIKGKAKTVKNKYKVKNKKIAKIKTKSKKATKVKIKGIKKGNTKVIIKVNGKKLKLKVKVK